MRRHRRRTFLEPRQVSFGPGQRRLFWSSENSQNEHKPSIDLIVYKSAVFVAISVSFRVLKGALTGMSHRKTLPKPSQL